MSSVRVRFAPSPTGYLHIGGLRTALYNYLFARRLGGTVILRIEDTDQKRFVADAEQDILDSLQWAGLTYDEGPDRGGDYGPYRQSERSETYRIIAKQLVDQGNAYIAFDSEQRISEMKERHMTAENPNPRYDSTTRGEMLNSLTMEASEVQQRLAANEPHVIRLKVDPGETITFADEVRGDVSFASEEVDDQVLIKSDGLPTYHLANIVDDHMMEVSHVIRGEEWLSSTPKHILLYRSLGWTPPVMAHLPLILSPTGGKLSKRGAERAGIPVSVREYITAGYESEALINFLALLGWNPGTEQEIFTMSALSEVFSLDRVGQSGVQFDLQKLKWYNEHYVRARAPEEIAEQILPSFQSAGIETDLSYLVKVVTVMIERISFPTDLLALTYFFEDPDVYDDQTVKKRWKDDSRELLVSYAGMLAETDELTAETAEHSLRELAESRQIGAGRIIHPVRLALSGVGYGPGLFELVELLGQDNSVRRLKRAADVLG